jgi:hypothetical protein
MNDVKLSSKYNQNFKEVLTVLNQAQNLTKEGCLRLRKEGELCWSRKQDEGDSGEKGSSKRSGTGPY